METNRTSAGAIPTQVSGAKAPRERRWTDDEGMGGVFLDGRLSIYGKPSMTADNGDVAVGIDSPWVGELEQDLAVERQALQLAQRQRDDATRWAQYLCYVLSAVYHESGRITQGGILNVVGEATAAGYEPIVEELPSSGGPA